jgi:hypothetical protein
MGLWRCVTAGLSVLVLGTGLEKSSSAEKSAGASAPTPVMVIVAYRPRPGKEALLLELTRKHLPVLRAQGLATERPSFAMRAADGTILEVFEWKSRAAMEDAHRNPAVVEMWKLYVEACEYVPLRSLKEAGDLFAGFEPVE